MTEAPDLPEDDVFAAEHALGVLNAAERARAETRMAREPEFAAHVEAWRERFAPLWAEIPEIAPSAAVWRAIERALPANDNSNVRFWRRAAMGGFALAAASLAGVIFLAMQPPVVTTVTAPPEQPAPLLNASLSPQGETKPLFIAAYDPTRKAVIVTSLVPPGTDPEHVHQLWLITGDQKPRSIGMVEPGKSTVLPLPEGEADKVAAGSSLAVSVEPPGGSPNPDGPSGPIAAIGQLAGV